MKVHIFDKGPLVSVTFFIQHNIILKIALKESNSFEIFINAGYSLEKDIYRWANDYAQKKQPQVDLPLHWGSLTTYQLEVLKTLKQVSFGEILSYTDLAARTTSSKACRAAGTSCKNNPFPLIIPCHRIVKSDFTLGGFNGGIEIKKRLLKFEDSLTKIKIQ